MWKRLYTKNGSMQRLKMGHMGTCSSSHLIRALLRAIRNWRILWFTFCCGFLIQLLINVFVFDKKRGKNWRIEGVEVFVLIYLLIKAYEELAFKMPLRHFFLSYQLWNTHTHTYIFGKRGKSLQRWMAFEYEILLVGSSRLLAWQTPLFSVLLLWVGGLVLGGGGLCNCVFPLNSWVFHMVYNFVVYRWYRLYFTKIEIGTPPKDYHVQVDTGSDLLWVNCAGCDKCPKKSGLGVCSPSPPCFTLLSS